MRSWIVAVVTAIALAALTPDTGAAQGRGRGNGNGNGNGNANGPAFCRSGAGHPVYGRAWCIDKGFGLGSAAWRRVDLGRVVLRQPRRTEGRVERGGLLDILGDIVFGRFEAQRAGLNPDEPLSGTWLVPPDGPRVLQVWAGGVPLGELVDNDRNGSIDLVVMNFGR